MSCNFSFALSKCKVTPWKIGKYTKTHELLHAAGSGTGYEAAPGQVNSKMAVPAAATDFVACTHVTIASTYNSGYRAASSTRNLLTLRRECRVAVSSPATTQGPIRQAMLALELISLYPLTFLEVKELALLESR